MGGAEGEAAGSKVQGETEKSKIYHEKGYGYENNANIRILMPLTVQTMVKLTFTATQRPLGS